MTYKKAIVAIVVVAFALGGCASLRTASSDKIKLYEGTMLNLATIQNDHQALAEYSERGIEPVCYPHADMPFSFVWDSVLAIGVATLVVTSYPYKWIYEQLY